MSERQKRKKEHLVCKRQVPSFESNILRKAYTYTRTKIMRNPTQPVSELSHIKLADHLQPSPGLHFSAFPPCLPEILQKLSTICPLFPPLIIHAHLEEPSKGEHFGMSHTAEGYRLVSLVGRTAVREWEMGAGRGRIPCDIS